MMEREKICGNCAHRQYNGNLGYWYCDLEEHNSWDTETWKDMLDPACDKFFDLKNEVVTIKCTSCGKTEVMKGRKLPEGWHPYLEPGNHKCPECREKIAKLVEYELKAQNPSPKTRSIAHSFFGI